MLLLARSFSLPKTTSLAMSKLEHGLREEGWEVRVKERKTRDHDRGKREGERLGMDRRM